METAPLKRRMTGPQNEILYLPILKEETVIYLKKITERHKRWKKSVGISGQQFVKKLWNFRKLKKDKNIATQLNSPDQNGEEACHVLHSQTTYPVKLTCILEKSGTSVIEVVKTQSRFTKERKKELEIYREWIFVIHSNYVS